MDIQFEWDEDKAQSKVAKHAVTFTEAASIFTDPFLITFSDDFYAGTEERFINIGRSVRQRILLVVHTDRGAAIRIISARKATARERMTYEQ